MVLNNWLIFTKNYEDPKNLLLGPNLKVLSIFGLLQHESRCIRCYFLIVNLSSALFVITQFIDLYMIWEDFGKMLMNISITGVSFVAYSKFLCMQIFQSRIVKLNNSISKAENLAIRTQNDFEVKVMKDYTLYVRVVTNMYWLLFLATHLLTIMTPFIKYASDSSHREMIKNGTEPSPQIFTSWFPFDDTKFPGYEISLVIHIAMATQGSGAIASYDAYSMAVMVYLKGQFVILREKCRRIFEDHAEFLSKIKIVDKIKECHRHHNLLLKQYIMFNSATSPVMFLYLICCSITICCSIVQLNLNNTSASEKFRALEFVAALGLQLFFYCWHSNEVCIVSEQLDLGVYESKWWKANLCERKMVVLLAGKLRSRFIIKAGPFRELSIPTFIDVVKATYSFYTLFTQMQEKQQ